MIRTDCIRTVDCIIGDDLLRTFDKVELNYAGNDGERSEKLSIAALKQNSQVCVEKLKNEFSDCFTRENRHVIDGFDPPEIIKLENDSTYVPQPVFQQKPEHTDFTQKITELLRNGKIVESTSPYRHNIVVVPNGDKRITIKYIPINKCTIPDAFAIPRADALL